MKKVMRPDFFSDQLALWGVDRPPADSGMLLNFIEMMAQNQNVPHVAHTLGELEIRRSSLREGGERRRGGRKGGGRG